MEDNQLKYHEIARKKKYRTYIESYHEWLKQKNCYYAFYV